MKVDSFPRINRAYREVFSPGELSLGLVVPIEAYPSRAVPRLERHLERASIAEELGFAALWLRDVPFQVPSFGDAGQTFDPFVYLGVLAAKTEKIALGVASIILPLRHPAHVAKAAASVDVLSGGRLLLGVASGDRPDEYPALNEPFGERGARFREHLRYLRSMADDFPVVDSPYGKLRGHIDMIPKPSSGRLPLLITGSSQQSMDWIAANGDGWMTYPRDVSSQGRIVADYRHRLREAGEPNKPVMQSLYVDLMEDPSARPQPIHLGFRSGTDYLKRYLDEMRTRGVNHVALNLRFNQADMEKTLEILARELLPEMAKTKYNTEEI